jgi:hypothetical protein
MRAAVSTNFIPYQSTFEGVTNWMYLDEKCLVTTGIGDLIDDSPNPIPWAPALALEWENPDGSTASPEAITAEWQMVKSRTDLAKRGGFAYRGITRLRLSAAAVQSLVVRTAAGFEAVLTKRFPEFPEWGADGQLGTFSLAWAAGPYFYVGYPKWSAAADRLDFGICADESELAGNYDKRNTAQRILFENAATVLKYPDAYDPAVLYWPTLLAPPG